MRLWDVPTGRTLAVWAGHAGAVLSLALPPPPQPDHDEAAFDLDMGGGAARDAPEAAEGVAVGGACPFIVTGGADGSVRCWDMLTGYTAAVMWPGGGDGSVRLRSALTCKRERVGADSACDMRVSHGVRFLVC